MPIDGFLEVPLQAVGTKEMHLKALDHVFKGMLYKTALAFYTLLVLQQKRENSQSADYKLQNYVVS